MARKKPKCIKTASQIVKKLPEWIIISFNASISEALDTRSLKKNLKNYNVDEKTIQIKYGSTWFRGRIVATGGKILTLSV